MDVVRRTMDNLGGTIETRSEPGVGTTITLRLPLTLAIIEGLLVQVRDERYILPLAAVRELIEVDTRILAANDRRHLVENRGTLLPYVDLSVLFGSSGDPETVAHIVVVDWNGSEVGLLVDHVVGQQQTVIKTLGVLPQRTEGVSGATILGDGSVALILDVPKLVRISEEREQTRQREAV